MTVKSNYQVLISDWRALSAIIPACLSRAALVLMFVCSLAVPSLAASGDPSLFRPGLRNSPGADKLSAEQLDKLLKSLREKTGLLEMRFDEDGFLTLGDRSRIAGGSGAARALIVATVDGVKLILLKNRRRSSEVAFARVFASAIHTDFLTKARIEAHSLEMDFSDFNQLWGGREVIAAFDAGFAVLHELAHAVLALQDDKTSAQGLGDCEAYINRIRRELGLPERQSYLARKTIQLRPGGRTAEILFIQREQTKTRHFYLRWETDQVGQIAERPWPAGPLKDASSTIARR
jgi:hypothetical protein